MAFTPDANTPIFRGKDAARVTSQSPIKQDKAAAVNIKRIRLLFIYCFISQMFSTYRAYETYQDFHSWDSLSRKNKFFLAWGVVTTVVMAFFTAGYMVLEYRRSKQGGKDRKANLEVLLKPGPGRAQAQSGTAQVKLPIHTVSNYREH
ncbi:hypothetical protein CHU98_g2169 [Xylaria longipes]|nr:hypothetical protein CHU98_g2169 [Xylaria longipes]